MRVIINCIVILLYFILVCCFWSAIIEIILKKITHNNRESTCIAISPLLHQLHIRPIQFIAMIFHKNLVSFMRNTYSTCRSVSCVTSLYMTGEWARWSFMHYQIYTQIASEFEIFIPKKINVNDQWSRYLSEFAFEIICMQWCDSRIIKTNTNHLWKYIKILIIFSIFE